MCAVLLLAGLLAAVPAAGGEVIKHRLANGITVLMMPGDWNRIVAVSAMIDAGSKHDPPKLSGLAMLTNRMLVQGTTTRTATELAELVDSSGVQLGTEATEDYASVYVTAIDTQLDIALEVLCDVLVRPAFDGKRLLDEQRVAHEALDSRERDPLYAAIGHVTEFLYADHPYALPVAGTSRGIDRISSEHLVKFHNTRYTGGNTVISVVGKFSPDDVLKSLERLFADYPGGTSPETVFPELESPDEGVVETFRDVQDAYVVMGFHAPPHDDSDYPALRVINAILGDGSGTRLQEVMGPAGSDIAVSTGSFCNCRHEGSAYILYATAKDADRVIETMHDEIERFWSEPVTDEELDTAAHRIAGAHVIRGQTNIVRAARLALYELMGLGLEYGNSFLDAVNRVDKDDVARVASKWLREPATVVVRPGKSATPSDRATPKRAGI
jgi:zinc protease